MVELLITILIAGVVFFVAWWAIKFLPAPAQQIGKFVIVGCALVWFLLHVRDIVHVLVAGVP